MKTCLWEKIGGLEVSTTKTPFCLIFNREKIKTDEKGDTEMR